MHRREKFLAARFINGKVAYRGTNDAVPFLPCSEIRGRANAFRSWAIRLAMAGLKNRLPLAASRIALVRTLQAVRFSRKPTAPAAAMDSAYSSYWCAERISTRSEERRVGKECRSRW